MDEPINNHSPSAQQSTQFLNIPTAIVIAAFLIAASVIYTKGTPPLQQPVANPHAELAAQAEHVLPVTSTDHILGNPQAPVKIVEFSDTECPFCKRFQFLTMAKVMQTYGTSGQVAWVYRQSPLDSLHSKARAEAEATECVAKIAGNDHFWSYLNNIFATTASNDGLDPNQLFVLAAKEGVAKDRLLACAQGQSIKQSVQNQLQDAVNSGMTGTPYSIVIALNGKKFPIEGAQDFTSVKTIIDQALAQK